MAEIFTSRLAVVQYNGTGAATLGIDFPAGNSVISVLYMAVIPGLNDQAPPGGGFNITDENGDLVWLHDHPRYLPGRTYQWHGREVVSGGTIWQWHPKSGPATLRVNGFIFTS